MKRILAGVAALLCTTLGQAQEVTIDDLYQRFNIRSIPSSFGPRLKYFCESYVKDYFPASSIKEKTTTSLLLEHDGDRWALSIVGRNRIRIQNTISGGTYNNTAEHELSFSGETSDWRSSPDWIPVGTSCVKYSDRKPSATSR